MKGFALLLFCIQDCLVQNVFGQCTSRAAVAAEPGLLAPAGLAAPYGLGAHFAYDGLTGFAGMAPAAALVPAAPFGYGAGLTELAYPAAGWAAPYDKIALYGSAGEGNVAVAGELPVAGSTAVTGHVPFKGAVNFGGYVPTAGSVSIAGQCACGCGAPYEYLY